MSTGATKVLTVVKGTDASLSITNKVYVNDKAFKELCAGQSALTTKNPTLAVQHYDESKQGRIYYYFVDILASLPDDSICLNSVQRDLLADVGQKVICRYVSVTNVVPAENLTFFVQKLVRVLKNDSYDVRKLREAVHELLDSHVVCEGQIICFKFQGDLLKLTVKNYDVSEKYMAGDQMEQLTSVLMGKKGPGSDKVPYVTLAATSTYEFEAAPNLGVKFIGGHTGMDIFKKGITPKELGIGGLNQQLLTIFRRAFLSHSLTAEEVAQMQVKHLRGILLYGPPGTGKTLIARQIGKMLHTREPKVVSGPEILNKFVGQSEENIRALFAEAEKDYNDNGENSDLHLIIFDELDAICKARGSTSNGTGTGDSIVNQLLAKMDGVNSLNNIIVVGMTNRRDMIDHDLLRPGRFELQLEVSLPDESGRVEILEIHTNTMQKNGYVDPRVNLQQIAEITKNYTGAELEGVVRAGLSYAIARKLDPASTFGIKTSATSSSSSAAAAAADASEDDGPHDRVLLTQRDLLRGVAEVIPQLGVEEASFQPYLVRGMIDYSPSWVALKESLLGLFKLPPGTLRYPWLRSLLLAGRPKSGKTAVAVMLAKESGFPFVRIITPEWLLSKGADTYSAVSALNTVFFDALKSPLSLIVLDDLEGLISFHSRESYNAQLAQTISRWLSAVPKENQHLYVIGTTSQYDELFGSILSGEVFLADAMQHAVVRGFEEVVKIPLLTEPDAVATVLKEADGSWEKGQYNEVAKAATAAAPFGIPIKTLLRALDRAQTTNPEQPWTVFIPSLKKYFAQ